MSRSDDSARLAAERRVTELTDCADLVRAEIDRVVRSDLFRSSRRSQQFLRYIVECALTGQFDGLKERVIGQVLYNRPADYDTSTDAIVRVIANDTRKRLLQYYTGENLTCRVKVQLPSGSYVPAFDVQEPDATDNTIPRVVPEAPSADRARTFRRWVWPVMAAVALCANVALWMENRTLAAKARQYTQVAAAIPPPPWSALVRGQRGIHMVLGDASVGAVQVLSKKQLPLAEYLNGNFIPEMPVNHPEFKWFAQFLLSHQYTTASYASTAVRLAEVARSFSAPADIVFSRDLSLRSVKSGDNFVVLGTSRANPWVQLVERHLNFSVAYDANSNEPRYLNRHPQSGELAQYVPQTAGHSRNSYGHVAFLPNLYQGGSILVVAGSSSQGTEAAGDIVTDLGRLQETMSQIGIAPGDHFRRFELLLKVDHTAGSPVRAELVAHRVLPAGAPYN